jgi:dipeptidyl aminopeptidase/acylaminoacyl peptidase
MTRGPVCVGWRSSVSVFVLAAVVVCFGGSVGEASFPGANGNLAAVKLTRLDCTDTPDPCFNGVLRIVDTHTGSFREPLPCEIPKCLLGAPAWSPSGELLAFSRGDVAPEDEVWVMQPDGSGLRRATAGFEPAWSPDGSRLVVGRTVFSRRFRPCCLDTELVTVGLDGSEGPRVAMGSDPDWGVGGRIAFVRSVKKPGTHQIVDTEIVTVDPDGRRLRRTGLRGSSPNWSPDGKRLVFERSGLSRPYGIFVASANGRGVFRVAKGRAKDPVWSPDGRKIAYTRGDRTFVTRPYRRISPRRKPTRICRECQFIDWQPRPR